MPLTPSESEEEHFARIELEKKKKLIEQHVAETAVEDRRKRKELHWMRCPKCGEGLTTVTLKAVAVDTCVSCQGMWLDAGELDQLVANDEGNLLRRFRGLFRT
jgi:acetyl-CoA carboxylase beta subunit